MMTIEPPSEDEARLGLKSGEGAQTYVGLVRAWMQRPEVQARGYLVTIAKQCGATPRAVRNWIAGTCGPSGETLINLMASHPSFHDAINTLVLSRREARSKETQPWDR